MLEDQLFERWQSLDSEERNGIFPSLFGRMRHLRRSGTKGDKEAAERFFMEVEDLLERVEKEIQFRKKQRRNKNHDTGNKKRP